MIVRERKKQTPMECLESEARSLALAQAEKNNSAEEVAETVADLICENVVCIVENKGNVIYVKLFNGQIFKLAVENLK